MFYLGNQKNNSLKIFILEYFDTPLYLKFLSAKPDFKNWKNFEKNRDEKLRELILGVDQPKWIWVHLTWHLNMPLNIVFMPKSALKRRKGRNDAIKQLKGYKGKLEPYRHNNTFRPDTQQQKRNAWNGCGSSIAKQPHILRNAKKTSAGAAIKNIQKLGDHQTA